MCFSQCCSGCLYSVPFGPHIRYLYICFLQTLLQMIVQAKSVIFRYVQATDIPAHYVCNVRGRTPLLYNPRWRLPRRPLTGFEASAKYPADVQLMRVGQLFDLLLSLSIYLTAPQCAPQLADRRHTTTKLAEHETLQPCKNLFSLWSVSLDCVCVSLCVFHVALYIAVLKTGVITALAELMRTWVRCYGWRHCMHENQDWRS